MEFKTTSIKRSRRSRLAAFTLIEFMVAAGLSGLLLAASLSMVLYTARSIASATNSVDLNARSRHAVDRMSKKLRQTTAFNSFSPTSVSVTYNGRPLTYSYDPKRRILIEDEAGNKTTLLEDCEALSFSLYKRNPMTNSFNQFPAHTALDEAKVIQVSWRCSRTLSGLDSGSSEMISAKIVVRAL